jgi:hypothetical protein
LLGRLDILDGAAVYENRPRLPENKLRYQEILPRLEALRAQSFSYLTSLLAPLEQKEGA